MKAQSNKYYLVTYCLLSFLLAHNTVFCQSTSIVFNAKDFGAKGDGKSKDTNAIQAAIDSCHSAGGGKVYLGQGTFISGTIYLKSHVGLFIDAGAVLLGSDMLDDYPIQTSQHPSYTGEMVTNKAFIYAENAQNISISGLGEINGNGDNWAEGPYGTPSFSLRPRIIHFRGCENVHVRDITLKNSASWVQSYQSCKNMLIDGITVDSRENPDVEKPRYYLVKGRNTDGMDLVDCQFVRVTNCFINSGDDAICLKSFSSDEGCRDITISNCVVSSNASGIKLGTESSGAFEDIVIQNCTVFDTRNDAIGLMTVDGARLERVLVSNISVRNIKGSAIFIRLGDRGRPYRENAPIHKGVLKDVIIQNVIGAGIGGYGCTITGIPGQPVENIHLQNINLEFVGGKEPLDIYLGSDKKEGPWPEVIADVPENEKSYPGGKMFGRLPAYGFFIRHGINIRLENIQFRFQENDPRPAIIGDDIESLEILGLKAQVSTQAPALIWLQNCKSAVIEGSRPIQQVPVFLKVSGGKSEGLLLSGNYLDKTGKTYLLDNGVKKDVVTEIGTNK